MRLFCIREEFFENLNKIIKINLFKNEWPIFFVKNISIKQLLLAYTLKTRYYFNLFFYARAKKLFAIFNVGSKNVGIYTRKAKDNWQNIYWGFLSLLKLIKIWVFSLFFFALSFYVLLIKRTSILPQTLFFWVGISMLLYWLLSGFVFFIKKYQFSRYTSVIQRFWRRSYILFWLIESGLLLVFFYLMVNSSQESFYMFDQGYFLKTHLFSWKIFIFKCILIVSLITYSYLVMLNLKWNHFNKNLFLLTIITILLIYLLWVEFYQIYWVSNFYANFSWLYDFEESIWSLEWDARRTRILNHYIMVLFLLKFWHIVFIFGCWIFFLLRSTELDTITYPLFSFNYQNFIILFLMMWLFMYPWFRYTFHWIAEIPYYWFYTDTHISFVKIFINDGFLFYMSFINQIWQAVFNYYFEIMDFINWALYNNILDPNTFIKHTLKNVIIEKLI